MSQGDGGSAGAVRTAAERLRELAARRPLVCRTFYREDQRAGPAAGPVLVLPPGDGEARADLPHLSLLLTHEADGYEGRALHAAVTSGSGAPLVRILYQLRYGEDPPDAFGTHGFTGLVYANDPETGAELQFSIRAEDAPVAVPPAVNPP